MAVSPRKAAVTTKKKATPSHPTPELSVQSVVFAPYIIPQKLLLVRSFFGDEFIYILCSKDSVDRVVFALIIAVSGVFKSDKRNLGLEGVCVYESHRFIRTVRNWIGGHSFTRRLKSSQFLGSGAGTEMYGNAELNSKCVFWGIAVVCSANQQSCEYR